MDTLQNLLHTISQGLMIPTLIVLVALIVATVVIIGNTIAEWLSERRSLKENIPQLLASLHGQAPGQIEVQIGSSGLLRRQRVALLELLRYRNLPVVEQNAVARRLLATEEEHYERVLGMTEVVAKIAPMFGLLGTLIPLGPGIIALGQGDAVTLSSSLLLAFDTTIAGLISAAICLVISRVRKHWYESYAVSLESLMECILEEAKQA